MAFVLALGAARAFAQCAEEQKLTASDAAGGGLFGGSVSVSGDTAVVGAAQDSCATGNSCGSAYVFRLNGASWVEEQKLTASDAGAEDYFGWSVSVSGDTAVVGARWDDCAAGSDCGSAYVFRFNGTSWVEEQKLTASAPEANDNFGLSVSVSGDTAVVGASGDDCAAGINCGAAYVFRFNGTSWVEEQELTASDAVAWDQFGWSVSVSGDTAVVGANQDNCAAGAACGSAYAFRFNGTSWVEEQKLTASDPEASAFFGASVSVSGDTAVVGADLDNCAAGGACGSAYVFRFDGTGWIEEQKLTASDPEASAFFGRSVSVSGDTAVVGAVWDDCAAGNNCGSAYLFRFDGTGWGEEQKLTASDAEAEDRFGVSVSVSGDTAVVGARLDRCATGAQNCGSAYVFRCLPPCGNGDLNPGEECDGGLGCTDCQCDADFQPTTPPSLDCQPTCGNGSFDPGEECDGGFGCTDCLCDADFEPTAPPSLDCQPTCGNGSVDPGEECDDGNNQPGDGCDQNCRFDLGACCVDTACSITTEADCLDSGGSFFGFNSTCDVPDADGDGLRDECDGCPDDPGKIQPGVCGCNVDDGADGDGDGVPDCNDQCPGVDDAVFAPGCEVAIPTVSEWGMIVMALLLLAGAKVYFNRHGAVRA